MRIAIDAAQVVPAWRGLSALVTCIPRGEWVRSEVEGMGVMATTGPLQRLTAQDLLIMLRPADLDWPKDVGAFAVPDPIGAEGRLATVR